MPIILMLIAMCSIFCLRAYVFAKLTNDSKDTKENNNPIVLPFFFHK